MHRSGQWRLVFVLPAFLCLGFAGTVSAQVVWDMPNVIMAKPKFDNSTIKARPDAWPRLDPGAVLCKTEADLLRLAAARRGEQVDRPNCQFIRTPTPIQIQKRAGPGRTQVSVSDQNGVDGWTDAWLPERAPPIGGKGVSIR
jgi:hypothetical protein